MTARRRSQAKTADQRASYLTIVWFVACFVLGGASNGGVLGNLVLQISAALVIAWAILRGRGVIKSSGERTLVLLMIASTLWIAITLVPLPPATIRACSLEATFYPVEFFYR